MSGWPGPTLDIREAMAGAGFLMITAPAEAAVKFFNRALPLLEDGQTVVKWSEIFPLCCSPDG